MSSKANLSADLGLAARPSAPVVPPAVLGLVAPAPAARSRRGVGGAVRPGQRGGGQQPVVRRLLPWSVPLLGLMLWAMLARAGWLSPRILPDPALVIRAAGRLLWSGELLQHVWVSFQRAIAGFVIGGSIGLCLGLLNGASRWAEAVLDTPIQMIRTVPHLALLPLVILWFGLGEEAKVFLVSIGVMFPMYVNTFHGARSVDPGLLEMGRIYGLSRWERFRHVVLPSALPSILVGVRFALGVMWLSLIVAETIAADAGIGYLAMTAREFMQTDVVVMSIVLYALLGKLADLAARQLERRWLPWQGRGDAGSGARSGARSGRS